MLERVCAGTPSFGILSTYPPTPCGLATFSAALADGLSATGADVNVVAIADGSPHGAGRVVGELTNGSAASVAACADLLSGSDIALIQHEYGLFGGPDGDEVLDILGALTVPAIVVAHTVPATPTRNQRAVLKSVAALADRVIVMSDAAASRLQTGFGVDRRKIATIPHGVTMQPMVHTKRSGRPTLLTWGLLGPGKGIERVIDSMAALQELRGNPRYLIAGRTHPKVLAAEGEAYREARAVQADRVGASRSVFFDAGYRDIASLSALAQAASVVVLPYDSTEQVTSGVLVDAIASGRPVVATAFPHAVELLRGGAGIVVDHDDPDAMTSALRSVLCDPRLAGAMAAEARRLAPSMSWSVVARSYQAVAQGILAAKIDRTWM
nr:glycosyltransferase [Mycolicibacterium bacteremicum]